MDRVHLAVALTPLAIYLLRLGLINLLRWPVVKSGAATSPFWVLASPVSSSLAPWHCFLPGPAAIAFGPWVWLLMIVFYGLCVTLWILLARPRLIVHNATIDLIRPILASAATKLDAEVRWAGDSLVLPQANVQLHLESYPPMRDVRWWPSATAKLHRLATPAARAPPPFARRRSATPAASASWPWESSWQAGPSTS